MVRFSRRVKMWGAAAAATAALAPLGAMIVVSGPGGSPHPGATRIVAQASAGSGGVQPAAPVARPATAAVFSTAGPAKAWIVRRHGGGTGATASTPGGRGNGGHGGPVTSPTTSAPPS